MDGATDEEPDAEEGGKGGREGGGKGEHHVHQAEPQHGPSPAQPVVRQVASQDVDDKHLQESENGTFIALKLRK